MNTASILSKAYRICNCNATTFLDGNSINVLADLNMEYGHRTLRILKVRQDLNAQMVDSYTDLISTIGLVDGDSGYNGEYAFQDDNLRPVRAEISYDGVTWNTAEIYDLNDNKSSEFNEEQIKSQFSENHPYIRFEGDVYYIRPLKTTAGNITGGIHIWYEERQTALTTGDPFFEENLHDVLAYDLAELELLMHPNKYTSEWRNDFRIKKAELNSLFDDFVKNRFKRNFKLNVANSNFK